MNKFDGPGKGRKKCNGCGNYFGVRTKVCPDCGNDFSTQSSTKTNNVEIKVYDEPGRGRKQCKNCKKYVGGKVKRCKCGSEDFEKKQKTNKTPAQLENEKWDDTDLDFLASYAIMLGRDREKIVETPSGPCPFTLPVGFDENMVFEFCDNIIDYGFEDNKLYTPRAIRYFARAQLGVRKEYNLFCKHCESWIESLGVNKEKTNES